MTISVIVTTTGRTTLRESLESVARQTSSPDEVVLVYDTPEKPQHFPPDVRCFWTGGSGNPCDARNHGARMATSKYVAFLDDDDYWLENHLACVKQGIETSGASVICTSFWNLDNSGMEPGLTAPTELEFRQFLCRNPGLRGSNLTVESSIFHRVGGFDPAFLAMNDLDLGIRLADSQPKYLGIAERTVVFRCHDGPRLSTRGSVANQHGLLAFWRRYAARMSMEEQEAFAEWAVRYWQFADFAALAGI